MHPLRHSASFPSLSSTGPHSTSASPIPPPHPDRHNALAHHLSTESASKPLHPASAVWSFPSSAPSSPPSSQYIFPSQPFTPPPSFARLLPRLYRCCTFGSVSHAYVASLRLRSCLYVSSDALPPSMLLFFQQHRIHLQLLCSLPPSQAALPAPSAAFPHPLSVACCLPTGHRSSLSPLPLPPLPLLLKPALEYVLSSSSHPLLLLSSSAMEAVLGQLVVVVRSLLGWPMSSIVEEWTRFAPRSSSGGVQALSETEGWLAEDELWLAEDDKVEWWTEEEQRKRRVRKRQRGREGQWVEEEDVEDTLERLFGTAFRDQRLISDKVVYDEHRSIVEDDDD